MDSGIIAARYAKALYAYATESGMPREVYACMECVSEAFMALKALHEALINPVVTAERKVNLLLSAARGNAADKTGEKALPVMERFFRLVVAHKRAGLLPFIAASYLGLFRKKHHVVKSRLFVAAPVSESVQQRMRQLVEDRTQGGKVDFDVQVDESLGGGFILAYDTYRLDASMRTRLTNIHRTLIN